MLLSAWGFGALLGNARAHDVTQLEIVVAVSASMSLRILLMASTPANGVVSARG